MTPATYRFPEHVKAATDAVPFNGTYPSPTTLLTSAEGKTNTGLLGAVVVAPVAPEAVVVAPEVVVEINDSFVAGAVGVAIFPPVVGGKVSPTPPVPPVVDVNVTVRVKVAPLVSEVAPVVKAKHIGAANKSSAERNICVFLLLKECRTQPAMQSDPPKRQLVGCEKR